MWGVGKNSRTEKIFIEQEVFQSLVSSTADDNNVCKQSMM